MEVIIGIDSERDRAEIERLGVESLSVSFIDSVLAAKYREAGFEVVERGAMAASEWATLRTSWAKRLRSGAGRTVLSIIAKASAGTD